MRDETEGPRGRRDGGARPGGGRPAAGGAAGPDPDSFGELVALVRDLRARCPWDGAQTPTSLLPYFLEECFEVAEAVEAGDDRALEGELGDLLLHAAFQIVLAEERRAFDVGGVVARVAEKMRRRHPHLFGLGDREEWEVLKARERGPGGTLEGLPRRLDPLLRAHRIQERVSGVGFDWADTRGAWRKVAEELEEVRVALEAAGLRRTRSRDREAEGRGAGTGDGGEVPPPDGAVVEELGDLLFAVVNLARVSGVHAVEALRRANEKFRARFQALERLARERGIRLGEADLETLDALWEELKAGGG